MSRTEKPSFFDYFHAFLEKMSPAGPLSRRERKDVPGFPPGVWHTAGRSAKLKGQPPCASQTTSPFGCLNNFC